MPVYEYRCVSCGTTYDVFHRGREAAEDIVCPSCQSTQYKKLMSAPAVATKQSAPAAPSCDSGGGGCCGGGMCGMN
jgi:putative FmdB family regulatory protein